MPKVKAKTTTKAKTAVKTKTKVASKSKAKTKVAAKAKTVAKTKVAVKNKATSKAKAKTKANIIQVAVLYGGVSCEHEVSLVSAASVISNLDRSTFKIIPIGIERSGEWYLNKLADVDPIKGKKLKVKGTGAKRIDPITYFSKLDNCVVFPVIHGTMCEDGVTQGLLELSNIAYVGAGVLSSAICMDKDITKRLALLQEIPIVPYVSCNLGMWQEYQADIVEQVIEDLELPVFVKPANTGSSIGISKAKTRDGLVKAIKEAFKYDNKILIEKAINARELEVSILENPDYGDPPVASVLGEIKTKHEFYDYEAKYHDDTLKLVIPAQVETEISEQIQAYACELFEILECEGMARVDFFVDKDTQEIYFNEINTLPGFTHVSMYPMMWQKSGLPYAELLTTLIELAINRYERKSALLREPE